MGVSFRHLNDTEKIENPTAEAKPNIKPLIDPNEALPKAIITMPIEATIIAIQTLIDIFNICSGNAAKLKDLLLMIASELGSSHDLLKFGARQMRAGEALVSHGSNKKAIEILGW